MADESLSEERSKIRDNVKSSMKDAIWCIYNSLKVTCMEYNDVIVKLREKESAHFDSKSEVDVWLMELSEKGGIKIVVVNGKKYIRISHN